MPWENVVMLIQYKHCVAVMIAGGLLSTAYAQENQATIHQLQALSYGDDPGVQYVVLNRDSVLFEHSVGWADVKKKIPLRLNHTMASFSMTKTLTAIAVLQLVEANKIKLDDVLSTYVAHPYSSDVTIRHLLNHTSGIPNPIPLRWVHLVTDHDEFDGDQALNQVLKDYPDQDNPAGEHYNYSNIGYWLLGELIQNVSKQSYAAYVTEHIFKPLNLSSKDIGFTINTPNHAKGYLKKWSFMNVFGRFFIDTHVLGEYEGSWLHIRNVYVNGAAFGGVVGTPKAFAKILQDFLGDQSKLLGLQGKAMLHSQQTTNDGNTIPMTLGWHVGLLKGEKFFYKEGGGAGFHSEMRIYPKSNIASVIMTNRTSLNSRAILSALDEHYIGVQP
ncbi:MAG: serine hydrolase domain-containing protein [Ghiorsea sp.]|nr:serine hydrolase domain-containing protein [Ghiorsea sp.]